MERDIPCNRILKKLILIPEKNSLSKQKALLQIDVNFLGSIHQEATTILYLYAPNNKASNI